LFFVQISLAPNIILFLFPRYSSNREGAQYLSLGQAVAAGGLLGDVFQHTLPHASSTDQAGLLILAGFTLFLAVDLFIRSLESRSGRKHHHHNHSHDAQETFDDAPTQSTSMSLVVLNMTADALHNFTDGLAIGASYAAISKTDDSFLSLLTSRGGVASLSILLHEVPHELGDYCTLIRAGYSKGQAIRAQFLTAIAAFMGTAFALFAVDAVHDEILLFVTAGGFLYMAATSILPEVLHDDGSPSFRAAQLLAFLFGVGLLYMVALLEGDHREHHHGSGSHEHQHGHGLHQASTHHLGEL
jgi:zinc transporter 7